MYRAHMFYLVSCKAQEVGWGRDKCIIGRMSLVGLTRISAPLAFKAIQLYLMAVQSITNLLYYGIIA